MLSLSAHYYIVLWLRKQLKQYLKITAKVVGRMEKTSSRLSTCSNHIGDLYFMCLSKVLNPLLHGLSWLYPQHNCPSGKGALCEGVALDSSLPLSVIPPSFLNNNLKAQTPNNESEMV